ncbi:hypothetical protein [Exiguobacterium sp. ZOR0005]|uniref:rhodanese-like domain-containing protein n=1 Tax=Exiguobacterium sp. ZOR0005 TaxID=1339226 RepID=UPI00068F95E0|nr:hypothetical protein [Exiguobacterium sp. ZOR0005]
MRKIVMLLSLLVVGTLLIVLFTSNKGEITKIDVETLQNRLENSDITLIDVREVDEYDGGAYRGSGERTTFYIK